MAYSVDKITAPADCDTLVANAQKEIADLDFKKNLLEHRSDLIDGSSSETAVELTAVAKERQGIDSLLVGMPDGKTKNMYIKRQGFLQSREVVLKEQLEHVGLISELTNELDIAQIDVQIAEINKFITAVKARKAAL